MQFSGPNEAAALFALLDLVAAAAVALVTPITPKFVSMLSLWARAGEASRGT